jgi:hypothetical protein
VGAHRDHSGVELRSAARAARLGQRTRLESPKAGNPMRSSAHDGRSRCYSVDSLVCLVMPPDPARRASRVVSRPSSECSRSVT